MSHIRTHNYWVYILTNKTKTVLYTGVTNDLKCRLLQHLESAMALKATSFAGKYKTCYLVYYELYGDITVAIAREKEIKGWARSKKNILIKATNPEWNFLNDEV